jgi:hypothetical protein
MLVSNIQDALVPLFLKNNFFIVGFFVAAFFIFNYFHKDLYKVPGPLLGALSKWYRIYYVIVGRWQDLNQQLMHEKYGDVVRYGSNLVMFANPLAIKDIYEIGKPSANHQITCLHKLCQRHEPLRHYSHHWRTKQILA